MISREDVLQGALHKCFVEMYRWAQPSIDLDELIKNGFKDSEKIHYMLDIIYLKIILII